MASPLPWYSRYPRDYADKTAHLSLAEHGAYTLLLDHYYRTGGPIMASAMANAIALPSLCHRICRAQTPEERSAVDSIVEQFFWVDDQGALRNDRADQELATSKIRSESRSLAGKSGANSRWNSGKSVANGMANAMANAMAEPMANAWQTDGNCHPHSTLHSEDKNAAKAATPTKRSRAPKTPMPADFALTPALSEYITAKLPGVDPDEFFVAFKETTKASGSVYADWASALQTWTRNAAPGSGHFAEGKYPRRAPPRSSVIERRY